MSNVLSHMLAMGKNRVLGANNDMPWHLPADLAYFQKMTMGKPVIMGRKTFEAMGGALPGRDNVVITRNPDYKAEGAVIVSSIDEAIGLYEGQDKELMIIGGAEIFEQTLSYADRLYITLIKEEFEGDTFYPKFAGHEWRMKSRTRGVVDEKNKYPHEFLVYERI